MRLLTRSLIAAIVFLSGISLSPSALAHETDVVFEGHGWGHGVGMSQYGAEAMAEAGRSAEAIVEYYFTDARVAPLGEAVTGWLAEDPQPLWVNITGTPYSTAQKVSFKTIGTGLTLCQQEPDHVGSMYESKNGGERSPYVEILEKRLTDLGYNPGPVDGWFDEMTTDAIEAFQANENLAVDGIVGPNTKNRLWPPDSGDRCVIETPLTSTASTLVPNENGTECAFPGAKASGSCFGSIRGLSPTARVAIPERKVRNGSAIELAHGHVRIRPDRDWQTGRFEGIHILVEIGVDDYVYGIDEIIYSWPSEALEAQAIASRAYAVGIARGKGPEGSFSASRKDSCWCHLWSNTFSQVYAGFYPETIAGGVWKAAADGTAGSILEHPTAGVVTAFFSSSNGGASEANEDAWGGSPVPYLRSVPDPWSLDTSGPFPNPYANWAYWFSRETVADKLGFDELLGIGVVEENQSGSARTVRFSGVVDGNELTVDKTGAWVRSSFGLRSNHYDVQWGDLSGPPSDDPDPDPPPDETTFQDTVGHTFEQDIAWALEAGVTKGCNPPENTLFCPDQSVTRGQMAAFLSRYLQLPSSSKDYFTDDGGSTFEDDINRLAEAGITKGCGGTRFCPTSNVSREQMGAFLVRAFGLTDNEHPGFDDVPASNTFHGDIAKLATAGITKGCNPPSNSLYCPADSVTRGQMAAFLHRASLIADPG